MDAIGPETLGRLLDEHGDALTLYARGWCETAEDVVQDALVQLVRQPRLPERVVPWLYRVVRNGAISASRAAGRRRRHEAAAAHRDESWFALAAAERLDAIEVTRTLRELPEEQRETIVARLWGGLTFEDIAELSGASSSTAHRRYEAGLAALRERLGAAWIETK
ncbi:MAG TPA: RNA polymerase sigma factor [Pirellulales bacterium]|jgi:RNA polymerase sigma-70 factor (ECF subfamily)|nr:RNA polymerase sigma factor [Pirellulales bacterium]